MILAAILPGLFDVQDDWLVLILKPTSKLVYRDILQYVAHAIQAVRRCEIRTKTVLPCLPLHMLNTQIVRFAILARIVLPGLTLHLLNPQIVRLGVLVKAMLLCHPRTPAVLLVQLSPSTPLDRATELQHVEGYQQYPCC